VLVELLADGNSEVSQAAQEALAAIPGDKTDAAVMAMLNSGKSSLRLMALELIGRRRMMASIPELLEAATSDDAEVRRVALRKVGALGGPAELSALLGVLMQLNSSEDLKAAEQALSAVCAKDGDPQSHSEALSQRKRVLCFVCWVRLGDRRLLKSSALQSVIRIAKSIPLPLACFANGRLPMLRPTYSRWPGPHRSHPAKLWPCGATSD
jgi:hypothetical protein